MRTTVDIDDALLSRAKLVAGSTQRTLGDVVDDALREFLDRPEPRRRTELPTFGKGGFLPGIDPNSNASLLCAADNEVSPDGALRE